MDFSPLKHQASEAPGPGGIPSPARADDRWAHTAAGMWFWRRSFPVKKWGIYDGSLMVNDG